MKYTAIVDGETLDIELNTSGEPGIEAQVGAEKYALQVEIVEPGIFLVRWNNRSIEISVTPNGDGYAISVRGTRLEAEIVDARQALRKAAHHGHAGSVEVRAPMPGKAVKVLVKEGEAVEMNQGILVIEAMKMQNEMKSPKKGIVRRLAVSEGAAVNAGELLAVVE